MKVIRSMKKAWKATRENIAKQSPLSKITLIVAILSLLKSCGCGVN